MCGFAGVAFAAAPDPQSQLLTQLGKQLAHRGPDAEGRYAAGEFAVVHRRLSVIDLSDRATQPLIRADLGAVVAYNGEIYNFRALRSELEQAGEQFETESDTEVLLIMLARHGPAALTRLRGMFALAFWRPGTRQLLLARDPLGKKPLFHARRGDGAIVFASSLECIRTALGTTPGIDANALAGYFAHLVVPSDACIYRGVERVGPGSWVQYELGRLSNGGRFWSPPMPAEVDPGDVTDQLEFLLRQSVQRRLVSDVPVGAFLSAGKDSGLVVALASRESAVPMQTFTAGTSGYALDERRAARQVAEQYATRHLEVEVPALSASALPRLIRHAGEPFGDASLLPSAAIAAAARPHVSVVLTGDGGDELFFGYSLFSGVRLAGRLRQLAPATLLRVARRVIGDGDGRGVRNKVDAVMQYATEGFVSRMGWDDARRRRLLRHSPSENPDERFSLSRLLASGRSPAEAIRWTLLQTRLPADYLVKVDIATMACGLEARSPFLDVDLVEFAMSLPESVAFPGGRRKALLTPLVERFLPPSLHRRPKSGFGVPIRDWLLGPLRPAFTSLVLRPGRAVHDWIDPQAARDELQVLERGGVRADRLWALFVFGLWSAMDVEQDSDAAALLPAA